MYVLNALSSVMSGRFNDIRINAELRVSFFLLLFIFFSVSSTAQNHTLSGTIKDNRTSETLIGALINCTNLSDSLQYKKMTDLSGAFNLNMPKGNYECKTFLTGYDSLIISFELKKDTSITFASEPASILIDEVVITSRAPDENIKSTDMGKVSIETEDIKKLPALMGEVDILKSIQLLPGVQSSGEGNTGLYIRGGGPDQNLILLDEAPIYNAGHLFGFFSVFNADAIKNTTLYKGHIPSNYGTRLSSVIAFDAFDGNPDKIEINGGVGLISSRLNIDGPWLKKDGETKGTFNVSGRRTYVDILSRPFVETGGNRGVPYYFYDLNGKFTYRLNKKNKISVSSYYGNDVATVSLLDNRFVADIRWGNYAGTVHWKHSFNDKLFLDTYIIHNQYSFTVDSRFDNIESGINSSIKDYTSKLRLTYLINEKHKFQTGLVYTYHIVQPRGVSANTTDDDVSFNEDAINIEKYAQNASFYANHEMDVNKRIKINYGLRYTAFQQLGPYKQVDQVDDLTLETKDFKPFQAVKTFHGIEPRVSMRYGIDSSSSVKAAVNVINQFMHMLSLSGSSLPFDSWVPSSVLLEPQRGIQYTAGYFLNLKDNAYETSVEGFYRTMSNQVEFAEDYVPGLTEELEREVVIGRGNAYGAEFLIRKNAGKLKGWIGYTISKTNRIFPDINDGNPFPARYDRRHDMSAIAIYTLNKRWDVSATFVYGTGQAITAPVQRYFIEGNLVTKYGPRNGYRMPAYHRMDLSATYHTTMFKGKVKTDWLFSIYNAYNRKNAFIIFPNAEGDPFQDSLTISGRKLFLFPILPSVTLNFKL